MADYGACRGKACPIKYTCARYLMVPHEGQAYQRFRCVRGECPDHWPFEGDNSDEDFKLPPFEIYEEHWMRRNDTIVGLREEIQKIKEKLAKPEAHGGYAIDERFYYEGKMEGMEAAIDLLNYGEED